MNPIESGIAASFEEQFANREKFGEREINVLDISPPNPAGTLYFGLGWNAEIIDYEHSMKQLFSGGNRIISAELSGSEEEKAQSADEVLSAKVVKDVDIIAHSVGVLSAVLLAEKRRVSKMALINPASMIGKDGVGEIIGRYKELMQESNQRNDRGITVSIEQFKKMAKTIIGFDMYEHLNCLREKGVKVVTVHSIGDKLFPAGKVRNEAENRGWDGAVFVEGSHLDISHLMPSAIKYFNS